MVTPQRGVIIMFSTQIEDIENKSFKNTFLISYTFGEEIYIILEEILVIFLASKGAFEYFQNRKEEI